jgi:hypothetical protein
MSGSARIARARRALISQLRKAEATAPDRAAPLATASGLEARELERMIRREVIRKDAKGNYWLDLERYGDWKRRNLLFAIGAAAVAIAVALALMLNDPSTHRHRGAPADTAQVP